MFPLFSFFVRLGKQKGSVSVDLLDANGSIAVLVGLPNKVNHVLKYTLM